MHPIFMNTENSKTNEPNKYILSLPKRLDLKIQTDILLFETYQFINYTWKDINKNIAKINSKNSSNTERWVCITWCLIFSVYSRLYRVYHDKKHETLPANPPMFIYTKRMNNRLVFKIKNGSKIKLQTSETVKYFGSTGKNNRQNKEWRIYKFFK